LTQKDFCLHTNENIKTGRIKARKKAKICFHE